jgi:hypothetical protein
MFNSPVSLVLKIYVELDLTNQAAVQELFSAERLTQVYLAAVSLGQASDREVLVRWHGFVAFNYDELNHEPQLFPHRFGASLFS